MHRTWFVIENNVYVKWTVKLIQFPCQTIDKVQISTNFK
jgi:hypothetical protein